MWNWGQGHCTKFRVKLTSLMHGCLHKGATPSIEPQHLNEVGVALTKSAKFLHNMSKRHCPLLLWLIMVQFRVSLRLILGNLQGVRWLNEAIPVDCACVIVDVDWLHYWLMDGGGRDVDCNDGDWIEFQGFRCFNGATPGQSKETTCTTCGKGISSVLTEPWHGSHHPAWALQLNEIKENGLMISIDLVHSNKAPVSSLDLPWHPRKWW